MSANDVLLELLHFELVSYVMKVDGVKVSDRYTACMFEMLFASHATNVKSANDSVVHDFLTNLSGRGHLGTLEYYGFSAGFRLIERLTKEWPRFKDELDTVKFMCTDFWSSIHKKPIDNLRTNHQGVYVLQDNAFRFIKKLPRKFMVVGAMYMAFTSGLLRGALANLGINCIVTAELQTMPACKFHIQVQRN